MFNGHLAPGFRRVFRRELRQIWARPAFAAMLLPYPLLLFILLSLVFRTGLPTDLPIAVVDLDNSTTSRQIVRMVDATSGVSIGNRATTLSEAKEALVRGDVYALLYLPHDFESNLFRGWQPEAVIFTNNQFLTAAGITGRAITQAVTTASAGVSIKLRQARGTPPDEAAVAVNRIPVQQSALFNPEQEYISFLLAAVMPTVLQIFISCSMTLSFSRDHHSVAGMARLVRLGRSAPRAILAKMLPYTFFWYLMLLIADLLIFGLFDRPFHGSVALHFFYGLIFVLTSQMLGAAFGIAARDSVGALGVVGLLTAPAFGFVGLSYPRLMMNEFSQAWGAIIPLTPYLELHVDQTLRGTPLVYSLPTIGWALALAGFYALLMAVFLRRSLSEARSERTPREAHI
ncbi:ABC transporter permease [Pseudovibrio exalbescens]|uniref:ABC-2 type transporter transmembrane domain-containing protein n=1 Tax=Pseudovibrio exalbescens TaxID=197461 RepID=A0A1U7JM49_9HYPH|nr:ABC transporter permease [Pseudovibrio exalbescens]OKL45826.1 hypothetical protein A3843_01485 [Pseudovibrio exalbescens]